MNRGCRAGTLTDFLIIFSQVLFKLEVSLQLFDRFGYALISAVFGLVIGFAG